MSLVAYSDSEEDTAPGKLPPVALESDGYRNEWLSYVYIPVSLDLEDLWPRVETPKAALLELIDHPHISLTRPLVLRKHEQGPFYAQVRQATACVRPFSVGFARFVCLPSDTSERVFMALEVSAGWHELTEHVRALNERLSRLLHVRQYYDEARFHASIAYLHGAPRAQLVQEGERLARAWNHCLCVTDIGPMTVRAIYTKVGQDIVCAAFP